MDWHLRRHGRFGCIHPPDFLLDECDAQQPPPQVLRRFDIHAKALFLARQDGRGKQLRPLSFKNHAFTAFIKPVIGEENRVGRRGTQRLVAIVF